MSPAPRKREQDRDGHTGIKLWLIPVIITVLVLCGVSFILCKQLYPVTLLPGITINDIDVSRLSPEQAEAQFRLACARMDEVTVEYQYDDYRLRMQLDELLTAGDMAAALAPVWRQEAELSAVERFNAFYRGHTRSYQAQTLEPNAARQGELAADWNRRWGQELIEPQMLMELDKVSIVPGQKGIRVATAATFDPLYACLGRTDTVELPIVFTVTEPVEDERGLHNIVELSRCTTTFKEWEVDRSVNLRLAAEQLDGLMMEPGEVFAFNEIVGQRTWEAGYRTALVVVGSKFEPELGGGICQVSSTLYDAALLAGLEIVERSNHGLPVTYIPLGLDATVYYGAQDFKFRNSQQHPIYLAAFAEEGRGELTICIYGDRSEQQNIKLRNIIDAYIPYGTQIQLDTTLPPGTVTVDNAGAPGYRARGFQDFYDETGEEVLKTITLSNDYYRPSPRILIVGMNPDGSDPTVVGLPSGEGAPVAVEPEAGAPADPAGTAAIDDTADPADAITDDASPAPDSDASPTADGDDAAGTGSELLPSAPQDEPATENGADEHADSTLDRPADLPEPL